MKTDRILILGVTGSGKGRLAFNLACDTGAEIVSIDAIKVYKRMDIGTAKPPIQARQSVRYHMIDLVEPSDSFSVGLFLDAATAVIDQISIRNKPVIAVGGTALYIKALLHGLFEGPGSDQAFRNELYAQADSQGLEPLYRQLQKIDRPASENIHPNDAKRIIRALEVYHITGKPISSFQQQWDAPNVSHGWTIIGLRREKTDASSRINFRVKKMIETGLVDEVKALVAEEKPLSMQARCAIGYAEIIDHLAGKTTLEEAAELIKKNTRRLAKGQRTWFKTFRDVNWLDVAADESEESILKRAKTLLDIG